METRQVIEGILNKVPEKLTSSASPLSLQQAKSLSYFHASNLLKPL
jgi:hypothetical protein